jgi:uracil-DNA glycosylase family 4
MIQTNLTGLFGMEEEQPREDTIAIMRELTESPCSSCRLGLGSPGNAGFLWKGNVDAHLAIISDMPTAADMSARRAFADEMGNVLNRWLAIAEVPETDVFVTYMTQCKTPQVHSKLAKRDNQQRAPHHDTETAICFPARCQRVVKSLRKLEVIWALGITTMKMVLGGEPKIKSHQGFWFGTDLFPGVAVFGMPHPRDFDAETSEIKRGRLKQCLLYFKNEYFGKTAAGGKVLCQPRHALGILDYRERERREARADSSCIW